QLYDRALALDPRNTVIWGGQALLLMRTGDASAAFQAYESALKLDGDSAELWSGKGDAAFDLGRYAESLECYTQAAQISPPFSADDWTRRGDQFYEVEQVTQAVECYDRAIQLDGSKFAALRGKGLALGLRQPESAYPVLDTALVHAETDEQKVSVWIDK